MRKNKNGIAAERLKDIRPFVDFNFNLNEKLTNYQKAKIRKYHKEITALKARPNQVYRPRRKDHLKAAQDYAQHITPLTGIKVAFIPTNGRDRVKVKFDSKNNVTTKTEFITTTHIPLDKFELLRDPKGHVEQAIKDSNAKQFSIAAGEYEITQTHSKKLIGEAVAEITSNKKYANPESNHYFGNWLFALKGYHFKRQRSLQSYQNAKDRNKKELQRENRNARRRKKHAKNK